MVQQRIMKFKVHFSEQLWKTETGVYLKTKRQHEISQWWIRGIFAKVRKKKKKEYAYIRMLIYSHWGTDARKEITGTNTEGKNNVMLVYNDWLSGK